MSKQVICTVDGKKAAPQGHTTYTYNAGDPLPAELHEAALSNGWGKEVGEAKAAPKAAPAPADEKKAEPPAPEKKDLGAAPENKNRGGRPKKK